jgi:colanic acid/amylovoran biosynthesis glycosyltransferase
MRLLFITASMPFGPGEEFIIPEVTEWIRLGHDLLLVPRSPPREVTNGDAEGFRRIAVWSPLISPAIAVGAGLEALTHPIRFMKALSLLFQDLRPKTLASNLAVFPKALWLARLARTWGAEHIHVHWLTTTATMAMVAGELTGIPWSFTAHRQDIVSRNLLELKSRKASFARFISRHGLEMAVSFGAQALRDKGVVIHMGVPIGAPRAKKAKQERVPTILCPANLYPVKGHRYLLEALQILKQRGVDCTLQIAGRGMLRCELEASAKRLAVEDRVAFVGQVPHPGLLSRYENDEIDAVVLPSVDLGNHLHEGIPVCLIEAMSHGVPVISTTTGGIPELLRDGAGILVPDKNPLALADAIEKVLHDPLLREKLIATGRQRVEKEFAVKSVVSECVMHIAAVGSDPRQPHSRRENVSSTTR